MNEHKTEQGSENRSEQAETDGVFDRVLNRLKYTDILLRKLEKTSKLLAQHVQTAVYIHRIKEKDSLSNTEDNSAFLRIPSSHRE